MLDRVLPAGTAAELLGRLADAVGRPVAIGREPTRTMLAAAPGVGIVERDYADDASLTLADPAAETLRRQAAAMDAAAMAEKLEAMAELAAGAGHEVNNPLATVAGRARLLLKDETDPRRCRSLAQIAAEAYRGRDMIGDLMLFARPPEPQVEPVAVGETIDATLDEFASDLRERELTVAGERQAATVAADRTQLAIVVSELLRNAIRFSPDGGTIRIDVAAGDRVRLTVSDDGPGLTPTERRHLFDPFFSGRQAGRGLGFGLPKCWRIVSRHGGQIDAAEQPMRVVVDWPSGSPE